MAELAPTGSGPVTFQAEGLVPTRIQDADDPRVAEYVGLTDVVRRTSVEPEWGIFLGEGELVTRRGLRAGYQPRSLLLAAERFGAFADLAADVAAAGGEVLVADPPVLEAITGFHVHRGVLASFRRLPLPTPAELLAGLGSGRRRIAILEGLNNTTNLGAVFRSAAALGVDGVLLDPRCCDPLYRRAVRVSMGEVFSVPYARLDRWPDDLQLVRDAGFTVYALSPKGQVSLRELAASPPAKPAMLIGAEGPGLSGPALAASDQTVRIPMSDGVDSLNVAAAAAVTFWSFAGS
jgi:tRNA G18 (ribose-2'-O)-methylase SpoU